MGLGPASAIYQAWTNKYLHNRGIKDTSQQDVWAFLGDGEMDEPESRGMIQHAAQQQLDNLTFVVNCNLQRLDGPVRGNGKIVQELEAQFKGAGWNVIKVVWGREWDALLNADKDRALVNLMNITPDGDYQTYRAESGAFIREHFFGRDPRTKALVENMTDEDIWNMKRGGHDYRKLYAAYTAARAHTGQPTVILAHTVKGYGLGAGIRRAQRDAPDEEAQGQRPQDAARLAPHPDLGRQLEADPYLPPYYHPGADAPEIQYMLERRRQLGGFVPERRTAKKTPPAAGGQDLRAARRRAPARSTSPRPCRSCGCSRTSSRPRTSATASCRSSRTRPAPSASTRSSRARRSSTRSGQHYLAVDRELMLSYKESEQGQIMHTGINEAGSAAAFQAVGHVVRDARRADDAGLLLLLDVRLPAHGRPVLGGRRPDDARLHHRRHRRPDHPDG